MLLHATCFRHIVPICIVIYPCTGPGYVEPRAAGAFVSGFQPGPPLTSPALPKAPSVDSLCPTSPAPFTPAQASTHLYTPPSSLIRGVSSWSLASEEKGKGKGGADSVQVLSSQEMKHPSKTHPPKGHPPMPSDDTMRGFTDAQVPPCTPPVTSPYVGEPKGDSSVGEPKGDSSVPAETLGSGASDTKLDSETNDMSPATLLRQKTLRLDDTLSEGLDGEALFTENLDPESVGKTPAEHETKKTDTDTQETDPSLKEPADRVPPKPSTQPAVSMYEDGTYWKNPCCI